MSKYSFKIVETKLKTEEDTIDSYGIACIEEDNGNFFVNESIMDISTDMEKVRKLIVSFEKEELAPVHFRDAVEDSLE